MEALWAHRGMCNVCVCVCLSICMCMCVYVNYGCGVDVGKELRGCIQDPYTLAVLCVNRCGQPIALYGGKLHLLHCVCTQHAVCMFGVAMDALVWKCYK